MSRWFRFVRLLLLSVVIGVPAEAEELRRGLVALHTDDGVFLSWRLLADDPSGVGFDVWRRVDGAPAECLNRKLLVAGTNFLDSNPPQSETVIYQVVARVDSVAETARESGRETVFVTVDTTTPPREYLSIPTDLPEGYHANDASVGDLDGDGRYEIIVKVVARGRDNSQGGMTDPEMFYAYKLDGQLLWKIDLGRNIRSGAHYNPFLVYDVDGDGRGELICRTADGTVDGAGNVIGDATADWRVPEPPHQRDVEIGRSRFRRGRRRVPNDVGKVLSGPEFLTVFDGRTGAAIDSTTFLPQRVPGDDNPSRDEQRRIWGDNYGNRMDRFLATVAYLDGEHPSLIFSRGYYEKTVLVAWDFVDGKLKQRWTFDSDEAGPADGSNPWRGQGNHSISVADVDEDSRDEIIFGSMIIDDDGAGLHSTKLGHGDAQHTSDLDPGRPGLEIWSIHENERPGDDFIGSELRDARTGELLFVEIRGYDVARGMAADIDPRHEGYELWGGSRHLLNCKGQPIGPRPRSTNMAIWWDGDLLRELLDGVTIRKWNYEAAREDRLFNGRDIGLAANNGSKSNPCLVADILGDWREELVARTSDNRELRIYVSTIPTEHRVTTLMHDRQYRLGVIWQNVGYNQPPHPSFFLGHNMRQQ